MRKRKQGKKFSRKTGPRRALLKSLVHSLLLKEKIHTTQAKAKTAAQFAERLITKAKRKDLASRRILLHSMEPMVAKKMIDEIVPRYEGRSGGYTRVVKVGPRKSDGAEMAIVELIR